MGMTFNATFHHIDQEPLFGQLQVTILSKIFLKILTYFATSGAFQMT